MNKNLGAVIVSAVFIIFIVILIFSILGGMNNGHAPGYGDTSRCTICGKPATHYSSNYGFCDEHWKTATGR